MTPEKSRPSVIVTDPHHEFFGRECVVTRSDSTIFVRPIYSTDVLSIESDQYEANKEFVG